MTQVDPDRERPTEYERLWRNKWLTSEARTIDDMIDRLQEAAGELRQMRAAGVVLREDDGVGVDYATLVTRDFAVAQQFGFEAEEAEAEADRDGAEDNQDEE